MDVWDPRVKETIEPLDQADDFDLQLVRADDRPLDRGIHRRRITPCCQDTNAFHK